MEKKEWSKHYFFSRMKEYDETSLALGGTGWNYDNFY